MPKSVTVQGIGDFDFPDEMSDQEVQAVIRRKFGPGQAPAQETQPKTIAAGATEAKYPQASRTTIAPPTEAPPPVDWARRNELSAALYDPEEEQRQAGQAMEQKIAGVTRPVVEAVEKLPETVVGAGMRLAGQPAEAATKPLIPGPTQAPETVLGGIGTGLWNVASQLSSPTNLALMATLHEFPAPVQNAAAAYFSGQMAKGSVDQALEATRQFVAENYPAAAAAGTASLASGAITAMPFTRMAKAWNPADPLAVKAPPRAPQPSDFDPYSLKAGPEVTPDGIADHAQRAAEVQERIPARQPFQPPLAPVDPDTLQRLSVSVGDDFASQRAAMGEPVPISGRSTETSKMPNGDTVTKLNPPDQIFMDALTDVLMDPHGVEEFDRAAQRLKVVYDIKMPITVAFGTEPMARTEFGEGAARIILPENAHPYELTHEIAEIAKREGDPNAERVHDNNVIADDATKRVAAPSITSIISRDPLLGGLDWAPEGVNAPNTEPTVESLKASADLASKYGRKPSDVAADNAAREILSAASTMGAGALGEYGENFYTNTLKPAADRVAAVSKDLIGSAVKLADLFSPTRGVSRGTLDAARAAVGRSNRVRDVILQTAIETGARMEEARMTHPDRVALMDAIGRGELPDWAQGLRPLVEQYRKMSDANWEAIQKYKPDLGYLENRLGYKWETPPLWPEGHPAREALKQGSLTGNVGWQQARMMHSIAQGESLGGKLRTDSPVQIMINDLRNQSKFLTSNDMWDVMKNNGDLRFIPRDGSVPVPDEFKRFDLKGDLPRGWISGEEGKIPGDWYIHGRAKQLLENYLSVDPYRTHAFGSAISEYTMIDKAALLAIPAFHATTMAQVAAGSQFIGAFGRAGEAIKNGDPIGALKTFLTEAATSPIAGVDRVILGNRVRSYFKDPKAFLETVGGQELLKRFPDLTDDLGMFYQVGGRLGMDESYRLGMAEAVRNAIANRDPAGAAVRFVAYAVPEALHAAGAALFENIPKLKVGMWLEELQDLKRTRAGDYASGQRSLTHDAGDLWNSVENRFGMVGYDLQFLNRTVKGGLQLAYLSYGWKGGTFRSVVNAATSTVGELMDSIDMVEIEPGRYEAQLSRLPRVTPELRAAISALVPYAALAATIQIARSGLAPWNSPTPTQDLFYPRSGKTDEDGLPERWKLPGYGPAFYDIATRPGHFWTPSSPTIRRVAEAAQNRTFFDRARVYDPNDPTYKQIGDGIRWALLGSQPGIGGEGAGPIYYVNWKKELERLGAGVDTTTDAAMVAMGASRASHDIDKTPFLKAVDNAVQLKLGGTTMEKADDARKTALARQIIREGGDASEVLEQLAPSKQKSANKVGLSPYESKFKSLPLDDSIEALGYASPAEKMKYLPLLMQKFMYPGGGIKMQVWQTYTATQRAKLQDKLQRLQAEVAVLQEKAGATLGQ